MITAKYELLCEMYSRHNVQVLTVGSERVYYVRDLTNLPWIEHSRESV